MKPVIRVLIDLAPGWRLGVDPLQWVLLKWLRPKWRAIAFIATDTCVLKRVIQECGITLTVEAATFIDTLPRRFRDGEACQEETTHGQDE